jgi:hypothetical protein
MVDNDGMRSRLSRRRWVLMMGSTTLLAQTSAPVTTPEQRLEKAKADVKQVSDKLAAIEVPMHIEPAFRFVA